MWVVGAAKAGHTGCRKGYYQIPYELFRVGHLADNTAKAKMTDGAKRWHWIKPKGTR